MLGGMLGGEQGCGSAAPATTTSRKATTRVGQRAPPDAAGLSPIDRHGVGCCQVIPASCSELVAGWSDGAGSQLIEARGSRSRCNASRRQAAADARGQLNSELLTNWTGVGLRSIRALSAASERAARRQMLCKGFPGAQRRGTD